MPVNGVLWKSTKCKAEVQKSLCVERRKKIPWETEVTVCSLQVSFPPSFSAPSRTYPTGLRGGQASGMARASAGTCKLSDLQRSGRGSERLCKLLLVQSLLFLSTERRRAKGRHCHLSATPPHAPCPCVMAKQIVELFLSSSCFYFSFFY